MGNFVQPEWIKNYCMKVEAISGCVKRYQYAFQKEYGYIYACSPYPGIRLWANEVHMHMLPTERPEKYHFIKLNYCADGRCEVQLEDDRFVYLEKGRLSIDSNAPKANFMYPGNYYSGLEVILDLEELNARPVQALSDCGFSPGKLEESLSMSKGSCLVDASREWRELAERLMEKLVTGNGTEEDFRFYTIQLFYILSQTNMKPAEKRFYLTRGQRMIVAKVEEKITANLKSHYTVDDLSGEFGISASSLKKYFAQVYGMSIPEYLREKRMQHACGLLAETKLSIADIAAEAGYSNQGKFGSVFKKYTSKTPLEYRRLQKTGCIGIEDERNEKV